MPVEVLRADRVGDALDGEDALVDVRGRVLEPHQRRARRVEGEDVDAGSRERRRDARVLRSASRDRRHAKPGEARGVRGVVVAAAVHVARARGRDDGVLGVVADGDEIVVDSFAEPHSPEGRGEQHGHDADEPIQNVIAGPKS